MSEGRRKGFSSTLHGVLLNAADTGEDGTGAHEDIQARDQLLRKMTAKAAALFIMHPFVLDDDVGTTLIRIDRGAAVISGGDPVNVIASRCRRSPARWYATSLGAQLAQSVAPAG